jgi:opacity protein-like surface antigen
MKNLTLSLSTVIALSTFALAGGDIAPVEPVVETPEVMVASDSGLYLGLGYSFLMSDLQLDNSITALRHSLDTDHHSVMFQAGYKINSYFAIEGRYWEGLSDDAFTFDNFGLGARTDGDSTAWGIYLKPMYPVTNSFDVYALLGYGEASISNVKDPLGATHDIDSDGFSWGIGASYAFTDNVSIFADYVAFDSSKVQFSGLGTTYSYDHEMDAVNFGVTYSF